MGNFRIANLATDSSSLGQARSDQAVQALRNASPKDSSSKIDKAAHDFESLLVGQWLEKAEKSFATVPGTDPDQDRDAGHDQFQSIACESLAKGLGKTGGFGIAAMISRHLTAAAAKESDSATQAQASAMARSTPLHGSNLRDNK
jgi:Rod binding domain-containing protein